MGRPFTTGRQELLFRMDNESLIGGGSFCRVDFVYLFSEGNHSRKSLVMYRSFLGKFAQLWRVFVGGSVHLCA
jgi:hypothetical protein